MAATVIGFGGRTPDVVLEVLSRSISEKNGNDGCGDASIIRNIRTERSQSIGMALSRPPYRSFLISPDTDDAVKDCNRLVVYCLPISVSEFISFGDESSLVRSAILQSRRHSDDDDLSKVVVAVYDPKESSFVGGSSSDVLLALGCNSEGVDITSEGMIQRRKMCVHALASAALVAISQIELRVASHDRGDTVVVIGSGGREHALAVSLAKSPFVSSVLCCPGNGGTAIEKGKISNVSNVNVSDHAEVAKLADRVQAKMIVVGPEQPLVDGIVDFLADCRPNLKVFGPTKAAAQLEASKAFTKDFLEECGIRTASYRNFTMVEEALIYIDSLDIDGIGNDRQVVKASGLAAGKGVLLPTTKAETIDAVRSIMSDRTFGAAGDTCVIESHMTGPEASIFAFCDGKTALVMPAAQDHKRALDGDLGLNTGGMGAYSPAPCVTQDILKEVEEMCVRTVEKMAERGTPYVGCLYAGVMLTPNGPSMLEYNCRFGDPETQAILPLLETDLYEIMTACCDGNLSDMDVRFKEDTCAATVVCTAKGYPQKYPKGMEITGLPSFPIVAADDGHGVKVYHAGTKIDDQGVTRCTGGRVIAVTGTGKTLEGALRLSYDAVSRIDFTAETDSKTESVSLIHYRKDIAKGAIGRKTRIGVLGSTRGTALIPIIEACASGALNAEIVVVLSNRKDALILEKGRELGGTILTAHVSSKGLSRDQYDAECSSILYDAGVELVVLVGYMRILSAPFCKYWAGRCINVHPSLLPKHSGGMDLAVHQAVIDAGDVESGCTIHQVTEKVDSGPIIIQKSVKISTGETAQSLKSKVQPLEGPAFVEAIAKFCGKETISYADAGVSINSGNELVEIIKPVCKSTRRAGCDADLGGFGGLFDLAAAGYGGSETVLIGATDGVGTKLRIAQATGKHESVGIDLVAMCVNDLIVAGGEPLFFLDYYATGKLLIHEAAGVVSGIAEGCRQAGCGLIGGETAEMPSMYAPGDYDLAGFSVGAVQKNDILPSGVGTGDVLLGLSSSGIHSNGFSLVRKLIDKENLTFESKCPWDARVSTIGDSLLTPTKIYVKCCLPLLKNKLLNGMAHITGGGLLENLPRVLPKGVVAEITGHPSLPSVFKWMQEASGLDDQEMLRTFNCGIGMVLIVKHDKVEQAKSLLREAGEKHIYDLGILVNGDGHQIVMKASL